MIMLSSEYAVEQYEFQAARFNQFCISIDLKLIHVEYLLDKSL